MSRLDDGSPIVRVGVTGFELSEIEGRLEKAIFSKLRGSGYTADVLLIYSEGPLFLFDVPKTVIRLKEITGVRQAQASLIQAAAQLGVAASFNQTPRQMIAEFYKRDPQGDIDRIYAQLLKDAPAVKQAESRLAEAERNLDQAELNLRYCDVVAEIDATGTASITYSDSAGSGYLPVTTNAVTVTGPSLAFYNGSTVLGMRQHGGTNSSYVYTPNAVASPLVVNLVSTDTRVATVPASVTIPAGNNYAYFDITAQDTVGTIQIQASAGGYGGAATTVQVTQPKFVLSTSSQLYTTSPRTPIYVYAADANGTYHYANDSVTVTLASSATSVAGIDSASVVIPANAYYNYNATWGPVPPTYLVGTSQLTASDARAALYRYASDTASVSVVTPNLNFSWGNETLAIGQYIDEYVYTPNNATAPIPVTFAHFGTARIETDSGGVPVTGVTIPTGTNSVYFRIVGLSAGTDTLTASASSPFHNPATAYTNVGLGTLNPLGGWPSTLKAGDSTQVTLYARDPNGNSRYVLAATTFTLAPNASIQFVSGGANSTVITSATIAAGAYYTTFYLKGVSAGIGSADISATNYQTYTPTVSITP